LNEADVARIWCEVKPTGFWSHPLIDSSLSSDRRFSGFRVEVDLHTFVAEAGLVTRLLAERDAGRDDAPGEATHETWLGIAVAGLNADAELDECFTGDGVTDGLAFNELCFCDWMRSPALSSCWFSGTRVPIAVDRCIDFCSSRSEEFAFCDCTSHEEESAARSLSIIFSSISCHLD
jgi:hypothetical protein